MDAWKSFLRVAFNATEHVSPSITQKLEEV